MANKVRVSRASGNLSKRREEIAQIEKNQKKAAARREKETTFGRIDKPLPDKKAKKQPSVAIPTTSGSSAKKDREIWRERKRARGDEEDGLVRMIPVTSTFVTFDLGKVGDPSTIKSLHVELISDDGRYYVKLFPDIESHQMELSTTPDGAILVRLVKWEK